MSSRPCFPPLPGPSLASPGSFPPPRRSRRFWGRRRHGGGRAGLSGGCGRVPGALRSRRSPSCCGCCSWGCGWGCGSGWGGCESGCGCGWSCSCRSCGCGSGCTSRCSASWRTRGWAGSRGWDACGRCRWKREAEVRPPAAPWGRRSDAGPPAWPSIHPGQPSVPAAGLRAAERCQDAATRHHLPFHPSSHPSPPPQPSPPGC